MVCSRAIHLEMCENRIEEVQFDGGCPGNLIGISKLVKGMTAEKAIELLSGVRCGGKSTSCPDQLSLALKQYLAKL